MIPAHGCKTLPLSLLSPTAAPILLHGSKADPVRAGDGRPAAAFGQECRARRHRPSRAPPVAKDNEPTRPRQQLTRLGLVDEYNFVVNPVILGAGKSAFTAVPREELELTDARSFKNGVAWLTYARA